MKAFFGRIAVIVCMVSAAGAVWAHHPAGGAGTAQSGPVATIPTSSVQKGSWLVTMQSEYLALKPFSDDDLRRLAANGEDPHRFDSVFHASLGLGHRLSDDVAVTLQLPYVHISNIRESHADVPAEVHSHGDAKGVGDLTVLGHYRFLSAEDGAYGSAFLFGLEGAHWRYRR